MDTKTPGIEVEPEKKEFGKDKAMLWKRRYQTSCEFHNSSDHKARTDRIIKYLHNDFHGAASKKKVFLNQFSIAIKSLIPMVVAHNPFVAVGAENDIVYEYDDQGQPIIDPMTGEPLTHNITETAQTLEGLLKKRLNKTVKFKHEIRKFLRDAIAINRGIFLVGHTANSEYSGAFNQPTFHAYLKSVSPTAVKRQAGTTRIDQGSYCFYEYELPVSHLKNGDYDQQLIQKCTQEILEDIKIENTDEYQRDSSAGYYDDVKYIKMNNAYDLMTGEIFVFGKGVDQPLKVIKPDYSFKNPFTEFIPNELFQPEQKEPISDLMMGEALVKNAQVIIEKAVKHVKEFNTGYDIERGAIADKKDMERIEKTVDRSFRVFANNAISGGKVRQRTEIPLGPEAVNMVEYLFGYFQKLVAAYDFQEAGRPRDEETATKTQAKLQTSQFKGGDMSEMFSDACNEALEKYTEILVRTTDTQEVVKCIGDAGEVELRKFQKDKAEKGQYYCSIDIQSMGQDAVKIQQAEKLYEIVKSDPDPVVRQRVNKVALFEKIVKGLGLGNEGILRKIPDTKGMDEQAFREHLKQQMIKAKAETQQAVSGADPLPPAQDDDDDIHLADHLAKAQELRNQAANSPDTMMMQKTQVIIDRLLKHAQGHIDRKSQKEAIDSRMNGPQPQQAPQVPVSNQPPTLGQMSGEAQRTGVLQ